MRTTPDPSRPGGSSSGLGSRTAWVVWVLGVSAYVAAVLQRTSFGVAATEAASRFDAPASVLSAFTVLQLLVYAALQVPAGLALDRFGARRLLTAGALLMGAGQLVLALASVVPLAVLGRAMVGAGDALTFVSVIRLAASWFSPRQVPVVTQLTGILGQTGQILSAVPLVALLTRGGWTPAFVSAATVSALIGLLVWLGVRDAPGVRTRVGPAMSFSQARHDLTSAWRHPGTRLGLWSHFTTQFPATVFALMWGYPFLTAGEGRSPQAASALITLHVLAGIAAGPVLGIAAGRHPLRRSWLVLTVIGLNVSAWTAVLAWPGPAPVWLLVLLMLFMATGGPGSLVGLDFARTFNPSARLGTATGLVNIGGFAASLVVITGVGVVLDATGGDYSLGDFRLALSTQYVIWAIGLVGILTTRRLVRRQMAAGGVVVPPIREALARQRGERRERRRR